MRAGTDRSGVWAAFHWVAVAPNPVSAAPDGVLAAAGEDETARAGAGEAVARAGEAAGLDDGEVFGSAAALQPVSATTATSALAAFRSFTEG